MQKEIPTTCALLEHVYEHRNPFKSRSLVTAKLLGSFKFISHTARLSREFESRKDS